MPEVQKVVLFPRFTALTPGGFVTPPINAQAYSSAELIAWRNAGIGTGTATVRLEGSYDLVTWVQLAPITTVANAEAAGDVPLEHPWVRARTDVSGALWITMWMVGNFTLRAD